MKFPEYVTLAQHARRHYPVKYKGLSDLEITDRLIDFNKSHLDDSTCATMLPVCYAESIWLEDRRPYYRVWPGVLESLQKIDLSRIPSTACLSLSIRSVACHLSIPVALTDGSFIHSMLVIVLRPLNGPKMFATVLDIANEKYNGPGESYSYGFPIFDGDSVEDGIKKNTPPCGLNHTDPSLKEGYNKLLHLAVGLALLDDDPELITPDVLADDRLKYERGDAAERERLAAKAVRRGKYGFDIGKELYEHRDEVSAHYRNHHWAIRWMGKGRTTPRLRHVKGTWVHRDKLTEVPTGYLDDYEEKEVVTQ